MQRLKFEALTRFAMRGCIDGRFFSQLPAKATNASQHCNTSKLSHQVSQLFPTSSGKVRRTSSNLLVLLHTKASTDRNETEQGPKIKNFQPYSAQSKTLVIVWGSGVCNNFIVFKLARLKLLQLSHTFFWIAWGCRRLHGRVGYCYQTGSVPM